MSGPRHVTGRRRRKNHEEHANHEAWAIPYADLLTLLLAFFVVMYAISSVNVGKYRVVSDSLFAAFRGAPRSMKPIQIGDHEGPEDRRLPTAAAQTQGQVNSSAAVVMAPIALNKAPGELPPQAAAAAALSHVGDEVERAMSSLIQKDLVKMRRNDFWIEVEMRSDILFPSGSARMSDNAGGVIEQLGSVLAPFPNPIRVEGHTDNKPIKTAVFSSNWELSAARAGSVVRVLAAHGVGPERLAVIGYGEQRPLQTNNTAEGRNANRRVVVVILSTELMRQNSPASGQISNQGAADAVTAPAATSPAAGPGGTAIAPDAGTVPQSPAAPTTNTGTNPAR